MNVSKLPSSLSLLYGQILYHGRLLLRMPRGIFSAFLLPVLLLFALRFLIPGNVTLSSGSLYLIIGPIIMGVVMTAYDSHALGLLSARTSGVLKRLHGAPLPSWCYFVGRIIATVVVCLLSSLIVLLIARGLYKFDLSATVVGFVALTVTLGALAWATLGTAITRVIPDAHSGQTILSAIYLPLLFISGTFSSFSSEPKWLQNLAGYLPARPIAGSIQHILTHSFSLASLPNYGILLGWAAFGIIVSALTFRWE